MRPRRVAIALGVVAAAIALADRGLPEVAAWKLRRELAARGFPDARFRVVAVERDRLELADVELAPGLALGRVELDAGISLLWRDPEVIAIRGARVREVVVARLLQLGPSSLPAREVWISDSVVEAPGGDLAVTGRIQLGARPAVHLLAHAPALKLRAGTPDVRGLQIAIAGDRGCGAAIVGTLDVLACATWPGAPASSAKNELEIAWRAADAPVSAHGTARLAWSPSWRIDARATLEAPAVTARGLRLEDASIEARVAGSLDLLEATGTLHARTARSELATASPMVTLADVDVPFTLELAPIDQTIELRARPQAVRARELTLRVDGLDVRGARLEAPAPPVAIHARLDAATPPAVVLRGPVRVTAAQVELAGARLETASATVDPAAETLAWTARTLAAGAVRASGLTGTASRHGIRWRAATARVADAVVVRASGRIDPARTVTWRAERARWRELELRAPHGRSTSHGLHEVAATSASWRDLELARPFATGSPAAVTWRASELRGRGLAVRDLAGTARLDTDRYAVTWQAARTSKVELGAGNLELARTRDRWWITRAAARAYGGRLAVNGAVAIDEPVSITVSGLRLGALLHVLDTRARGSGRLDGLLVLHAGELERLALASRGGSFQLDDRRWVDRAVSAIAAGQVAMPERIGGALADFGYRRLSLELGRWTERPSLRVELAGTGRRVPQELDLVINVRGTREAASLLARAREAL